MNTPSTLFIVAVIALPVVVFIVWLLHKAEFRVKEVTLKAGPVEAKMEPGKNAPEPDSAPVKARTEAVQEAVDGGTITEANIKAPADAGAELRQKAEGTGSSVSNSTIELS